MSAAKKRSRPSAKVRVETPDLVGDALPSFIESTDAYLLTRRVYDAAADGKERAKFLAFARRAYDDTAELANLYRELPGVFAGRAPAIRAFRDVLDRAVRRSDGEFVLRRRPPGIPNPDPPRGRNCRPRFFVKPDRIHLIVAGVERVTAGNRARRDQYVAAVDALWRQTEPAGRLYRLAVDGIEDGGYDRLTEHLRLYTRDLPPIGGDPGGGALAGWIPDPGDPWPPGGGEPIPWPPNEPPVIGPPEEPLEFCDWVHETCRTMVVGGFARLQPLPEAATAAGITSISPASACPGQTMTIRGSGFGARQPANVSVVVAGLMARVVSWSDTEIQVVVPVGATAGCVGFRDEAIEAERFQTHLRNERALEEANEGLLCLGAGRAMTRAPYTPSAPPCTGFNDFAGTEPFLNAFFANGQTDATIEPGTALVLSWDVENAASIRVRRTSTTGPPVDQTNPPGDSLLVGPFTEMRPVDATYELAATNSCGEVSRTVTVRLRKKPALQILGIELVQALQRFSLINRARNNSVRLVAHKRTLARVYVDSGISDGFDNDGGSPNAQGLVVGRVIVETGAGGRSGATGPLNPLGVFTARPAAQINRGDLCHTLNFELPWRNLEGEVTITAHVGVRGTLPGSFLPDGQDLASVAATFRRRGRQVVVMVRMQDNVLAAQSGNPQTNPPTEGEYAVSLQGARTRYPVAEDDRGFVIRIAPGYEVTPIDDHDLSQQLPNNGGDDPQPWYDLLDDLEDIAGDFRDEDEIWAAIIPDDSRYSYNGMGTSAGTPRFVARTAYPATFAHEMGHCLGIGHAACSDSPPLPTGIDPRLPIMTEDVGADVASGTLIPAGTSELMSYCTPNWSGQFSCAAPIPAASYQDRWPSIRFWNIVFNALP